ncbi:MAG TPA: FtsX-like permease family protein [Anaerolineaceae bacterium]|nr:FtsX-like permease family protein [Anaerolineaceae bacterium]
MEKLFGLEMVTIAGVLSAILAVVILCLVLIAWRRPVFFKLGLRPIPRRPSQSILIVMGLMLATLIITAAFVTGDTLSHTIRTIAIQGMGEMDEQIRVSRGSTVSPYFRMAQYESLSAQLAGYSLVDRLLPAISESVPVVNSTRRRSLRSLAVMGLRPEDVAVIPGEEITNFAGVPLSLAALGANEVYLNAGAAEALSAAPGDSLDIYVGKYPKTFTVRDIAARGKDPRLLLSLVQAQGLFGQRNRINLIVVSNQGDALVGVAHSQEVTSHLRGLLSDSTVAAQLYAFLAGDPAVSSALRKAAGRLEGNTKTDLLSLADGLQAGSLSPETRSLLADEGLANRVQSILTDDGWGSERLRDRLSRYFSDLSDLVVEESKRDILNNSDLAASAFTTIFVVSGLFGITAGLILIFLIFVMLAAERKSEMGMARAVGAQRSHLVEMFVFEGTTYDLAAAFVGVALGVGVGLIIAVTLGQAFAGMGLTILPAVSARSLLVSFSLGMLVTFATVLFSANRVSHLNIVSAIRDLPDPPHPPSYLRDRLLGPFRAIAKGFREFFHLRILPALRSWLVGLPRSLFRLVWLGFTSGPLTLLLGLLLTPVGIQNANAAAYTLGVSFVIIGGALVLRGLFSPLVRRLARGRSWDPVALLDRVTFTLMGLALTIFWSLPTKFMQETFGIPDMSGGPEMLFISGILLVAGAVLVIMYNTDLLLRLILAILGGSPRFAPVLRMAIAYPLSSRFRTGMTIAIFAVITFSVIFMATLFKVNEVVLNDTEKFTGGFNLRINYSSHNPIKDLSRAISRQPDLRREDYDVIASLVTLPVELKQGQAGRWAGYLVQAADDPYLKNVDYGIGVMAEGYTSAAQIWETVRTRPGYAVVDRLAVPSRSSTNIMIGGPDFRMQGVYLEDKTMKPILLQAREPNTHASFEVTVIGVLEQSAITGYGLITSQDTLKKGLDSELPSPAYYIRLAKGVDPAATSTALEGDFLKNGLESTDLVKELRDSLATQFVFQNLLLGFLMVGLIVGVAALGVISTRAVVERRQQIGMLRALGFQREMVSWIFLVESSFVSLLGIGLGVGLALIPASQVITDMAADIPGITFQVPWTEIGLVAGLAYTMTFLTTWLPSVQASQVTPAEALRYE